MRQMEDRTHIGCGPVNLPFVEETTTSINFQRMDVQTNVCMKVADTFYLVIYGHTKFNRKYHSSQLIPKQIKRICLLEVWLIDFMFDWLFWLPEICISRQPLS